MKKEKSDEVYRLYDSIKHLDQGKIKEMLESAESTIGMEVTEINNQIGLLEEKIAKVNVTKVDFQMVRETLKNFDTIFGVLSLYEQQ